MCFSVAPMMDWTDRRCRVFHRALSRRALLFTEMVTADAIIHGDRDKLLGFDPVERPLVLQLGGSDPEKLFRASQIAAQWGYDGLNLNVGCPSDRVQSGRFGACLMREPALVADIFRAMVEGGGGLEVTIKHRLGVDEQEPAETLLPFVDTVAAAGCTGFYVHARKAWLKGLSPRENREVPPLDYALVHALKAARPDLQIHLNGGLTCLDQVQTEAQGLDGVMLGRAAYQTPALLLEVDPRIYGSPAPHADVFAALDALAPQIAACLVEGVPLHAMTRHMLGLFHGQPCGRIWRRILTVEGVKRGAGLEVLRAARAAVETVREPLASG